ncbi:MAG: hypothetical protein K2P53_01590, partial [Rickettsiales bacterium]|nr:hypothetical protein [Rickettsiales bacterium]
KCLNEQSLFVLKARHGSFLDQSSFFWDNQKQKFCYCQYAQSKMFPYRSLNFDILRSHLYLMTPQTSLDSNCLMLAEYGEAVAKKDTIIALSISSNHCELAILKVQTIQDVYTC